MFQNNCYDMSCTVIVVLQEKLKSQPEQHSTRAEKFVTQATEKLILDGKELSKDSNLNNDQNNMQLNIYKKVY